MPNINDSPYKGSGSLTRAQFLYYEMRTTARLMTELQSDEEVIKKVISENLFQYPTEKSLNQIARDCLSRLHALEDDSLVKAIANLDSGTGKQICLYAMMRKYRLIWDFMITVIGGKYRQLDASFNRSDINAFIMRLQEQDDYVASWSESTCKKISSVLARILIENEYIDNGKATTLKPVLICRPLEAAIRETGMEVALSAFNCLS